MVHAFRKAKLGITPANTEMVKDYSGDFTFITLYQSWPSKPKNTKKYLPNYKELTTENETTQYETLTGNGNQTKTTVYRIISENKTRRNGNRQKHIIWFWSGLLSLGKNFIIYWKSDKSRQEPSWKGVKLEVTLE